MMFTTPCWSAVVYVDMSILLQLAKFPMFTAQVPCNGSSNNVSSSSETAQPVDSAELQGDCFISHLFLY